MAQFIMRALVLAAALILGGCVTTSYQWSQADTMCEQNGGLREVRQVHPYPYFECNNGARFYFHDLE